jgi:type IV pilus assembly protein PilO
MTLSGDFSPEQGRSGADAGSAYPVIFGVELKPSVGGIILAVVGLGAAIYAWITFVQPLWQQKQELEQAIQTKQQQLSGQQQTLKQLEQIQSELAAAQQQQTEVLSLFANPDQLQTLLFDLNQIVKSRNGVLVKFEPVSATPEPVTDSSLGAGVAGKVNRQVYRVELEGTFEEIRSIVLTLERLQPLLIVKNLKTELGTPKATLRKTGNKSAVLDFDRSASKLQTSFDLIAVTANQVAPATASPAPTPTP